MRPQDNMISTSYDERCSLGVPKHAHPPGKNTEMKIAFDGTVLHGRKSGVGYYCEELLKAMLAANHEDQFFVFSHQPLAVKFPSSNGNLRFTNSVHFPVRAVYLHLLLP